MEASDAGSLKNFGCQFEKVSREQTQGCSPKHIHRATVKLNSIEHSCGNLQTAKVSMRH
jgi:hypothetical protein